MDDLVQSIARLVDRVEHHPTCSADYPEKMPGERPQQLTSTDLDDGEVVLQCVDCGAFVVVKV